MKIKKGDTVQIMSGKDKGKKGRVIKTLPKENRVIVENVNLRKKHRKPKKGGQKGERIEIPAPISASSVQFVCKNCSKLTRAGFKVLEGGAKIRICKKCGQEL